jgi:hypothetical protein
MNCRSPGPHKPVRPLIDAKFSLRFAARLRSEGHEAVHVADIGMFGASGEAVLAHAAASVTVIDLPAPTSANCSRYRGQRGRRLSCCGRRIT